MASGEERAPSLLFGPVSLLSLQIWNPFPTISRLVCFSDSPQIKLPGIHSDGLDRPAFPGARCRILTLLLAPSQWAEGAYLLRSGMTRACVTGITGLSFSTDSN